MLCVEFAVKGAVLLDKLHRLFKLPEPVFVKKLVIHSAEIAARGLRAKFLVLFYPHPAQLIQAVL